MEAWKIIAQDPPWKRFVGREMILCEKEPTKPATVRMAAKMEKTIWNFRREVELLLPHDKCPFLISFTMNIITWNSRGVLKPNFQNHMRELARNHNPAILVIMETKIGGARAKEITDRLSFDGAIHTETIGFTGGLWLLWNSDIIVVVQLANTEQEIHMEVKVLATNLSWIFSAVYASPRNVERCIL